ncbi:hypothetical protein SFRURICE_010423, partial [Spodoptera frugiperda]
TPNSDVNNFFVSIEKTLSRIHNKKQNIIICGDFNIDLLVSDKNWATFRDLMLNYGGRNYINEPTRHNKCIDNHNTAQTVTIKDQTIDVKGYYYIIKDDLSKENVIKFIDYISYLSFSEVYDTSDTNEAFEKFHDLLILFYKLCFPSIRVKKKCNISKPKWITRGIKTSSKNKRSLRFIYYLNKNNENKNRKCMYNLQALCNQTHIAQSNNKVKATWNVVRQNTGKIKCRNDLDVLKDNNITITSVLDIANTFNNFFVNFAINDESNNIDSTSQDNSIFIEPSDDAEVCQIIRNLKNTKSFGYDNISTDIIKCISRYISPPLAHIINLSLEQGAEGRGGPWAEEQAATSEPPLLRLAGEAGQ